MFARLMFRTCRPAGQAIRKYASEASPKPSSNAPLYGGLALAAGGAYYYWQRQQSPQALEAALKERSKVFVGGDQGWVDLKLAGIETLSHNVKRFRFEFPDPESVSGLHIASALLTKYKGPKDEKPTIRPYTPVSEEEQPGYLDLVVKQYPNGPMSTHLHNMAVGQQLSFKGPIPKYPWEENKHDHICMIAGGTGITPMYQIIRKIFNNPNDKTKVTLVFGNITEEDILLKKELDILENTYPRRFRAFYLLDKPPAGWTQGTGYVTKELLKTVLPEPKTENIKIFVCGPPGMYKAVSGPKNSPKDQGELTGLLKELGYDKDQVYKF
ncbi:Oxidoreductase NAD-binding domain containing protein [Coccidioides posadasii C735 delta SOWgp]|uniref:NADH-cytochrome b5 reductase n=2 Tax=Coccidioides posadasii TaxID=199306 RepID=A0A0J6FBN3_COCPO|nr:Oxidoreductase NAD-binding domain containing protein [Coccidioides posadasii C735 delta SOWgp]EER29264.1 Oxidoreductase NAD-binding domain containing protein [Coccidioides posadasii C735 delta SOWgp]KMM70446.1 NADH-cytochrome b5 reductase 3 [Coccidioides posadasii RMSCC 3488]|eukprot:XP_003071409.1 Oxidoreductase NAD-binding domain containing protein [Coccidioides posadasii C735 delta SOWgp]